MTPDDWITLPNGHLLHRDDLGRCPVGHIRAWEIRLHRQGVTWDESSSIVSVACPDCLPLRDKTDTRNGMTRWPQEVFAFLDPITGFTERAKPPRRTPAGASTR
jgi:hypothetical protein